jgi:hypothetical protein
MSVLRHGEFIKVACGAQTLRCNTMTVDAMHRPGLRACNITLIARALLSSSANFIQCGAACCMMLTQPWSLLHLQTVAAFNRPHPGQSLRGVWNFIHHNNGRLAILVAWATIWLGVAIGLEDLPGSLARWVAPLAGRQGLWVDRAQTGLAWAIYLLGPDSRLNAQAMCWLTAQSLCGDTVPEHCPKAW